MIAHQAAVRVRYGEVDRMGFLYHSHYVELFDVGRSELMREIGMPNAAIEDAGVMLPVLKVVVNYRNPAYYDDLLIVRTRLDAMPGAKVRFDYEVFRNTSPDVTLGIIEDSMANDPIGECITTGSVTLAFMHADTKTACRPPRAMLDNMARYFA